MTHEDCKYQYIHPRKAYKKARWIKAWIRYHEREGYLFGKKRHLLGYVDKTKEDKLGSLKEEK